MALRSWLIVPADSEKKLGMAMAAGADAVVIDLADSVATEAKEAARGWARDWLVAHQQHVTAIRQVARWVIINPLDSRQWRDDLLAVMQGRPNGIVLPRAAGPEAVRQLSAELYEIEQRSQIPPNATRVIAMSGETAAAALTLPSYADAPLPRLSGLAWDYKALTAALGASRARDAAGNWTASCAHVRTQVLLAAHARGIVALEPPHRDVQDTEGLSAAIAAARADGFSGMFAVHPAQVEAINAAFTPSETEHAEARAIVAAHAGEPAGAAQTIDRRVLDTPAVVQAKRLLGIAD
jgi:citrate lyase subunit beta/citryl-CoA lyase